jgi:hypothetical protein
MVASRNTMTRRNITPATEPWQLDLSIGCTLAFSYFSLSMEGRCRDPLITPKL